MPKISVIMPFYNCEKYLNEAILSILNQSFTDFELILINDASVDNSDSIVKKYLNDSRILYIKNETNKKIVHNLNYGLSIAKADTIARMDGDDISDITRFEKQYRYLQNNPGIALVGSFAESIDEEGHLLGKIIKPTGSEKITKVAMFYAPFIHPTIMFRKCAISKVGNYRLGYVNEDIDLFFRVIFSGNKTDNVPEYLLKYRQHKNNVSFTYNRWVVARQTYLLKKEIIKKYKPNLNFVSRFSVFAVYLLQIIFTTSQKQRIEVFLKSFFVKYKIV